MLFRFYFVFYHICDPLQLFCFKTPLEFLLPKHFHSGLSARMSYYAFGAGPYGKRPASGCSCMHGHHSFGCGYTQHVENAPFSNVAAPSFAAGHMPLVWPPVQKRRKYVAASFYPGVFVCISVCCAHILTSLLFEQDV